MFPSLKDEVNEVIDWAGQLNHVIFGQVFNPYVKKILLNGKPKKDKSSVIHFLESMATSDDSEVVSVLITTVLEELLDNPDEFKKMESQFLEKTASYLPPLKKFFEYDERKAK